MHKFWLPLQDQTLRNMPRQIQVEVGDEGEVAVVVVDVVEDDKAFRVEWKLINRHYPLFFRFSFLW